MFASSCINNAILYELTQNASIAFNEHTPKKLNGQEIKRSQLKLTTEIARVKHEIKQSTWASSVTSLRIVYLW